MFLTGLLYNDDTHYAGCFDAEIVAVRMEKVNDQREGSCSAIKSNVTAYSARAKASSSGEADGDCRRR